MKNFTHIRIIEELVDNIISSYEEMYERPIPIPIPIIDIAEKIFHLKVDLETLKEKFELTSGIIFPEKRWIILNEQLPETRLNFTAAHELGHWLIDSNKTYLQDSEFILLHPLASKIPAQQEQLANYFAGAILMPKSILASEIRRHQGIGNAEIKSLSKVFNVSEMALSIRLYAIGDELQNLKYPLRLTESPTYEFRGQSLSKEKKWKYTIVSPDYLIFEHNLCRKLKGLKDESDYLYIVTSAMDTECVESLIELQFVDGFIVQSYPQKNAIKHNLGPDSTTRFINLENGGWLPYLQKSPKNLLNNALVFYPRSKDGQLLHDKKDLLNLNYFIESPIKLNNRDDAKVFIADTKRNGKRVVVVTGCFDLITNAHVRFLKRAKTAGDVLVVGIEDDVRVRAFKGQFRPVNTASQRTEVMDALEFVDFTFVINGSPKYAMKSFYTRLHQILRADVLAISEGDPYTEDRKEEIEAGGGTLAIVSRLEEGSTTSLIRQFLAETEFSEIVYISKAKLKSYKAENQIDWRQLAIPWDI